MSQKVLNSIFEMFPACTAMSRSRGKLEDKVSLLNRKARTTDNTNRYSVWPQAPCKGKHHLRTRTES